MARRRREALPRRPFRLEGLQPPDLEPTAQIYRGPSQRLRQRRVSATSAKTGQPGQATVRPCTFAENTLSFCGINPHSIPVQK